MSDSDGELELLKLGRTIQKIGDHELKTSPLVTRDAVNISEGFAQRGLLGSVLSVHADGLPDHTVDPRIYLNLDAPSSGLVCGVQGSGKSHTVSCILESSLIGNRQIGTLPAPLETVVFHFDEENGERPCEAAYLSEFKDDAGLGVEVVVLVSPSNLRTRRRVYSSLKFVRVEPLRIAEHDLNATRMLSMMGADNLETMPLYMHTILSILREMGSDDFNYRDFRERLKDPEFNKSQGAMLQLRLELLDSFLQGSGPDVKSFFKPGRLVIIDISDPFVESTTAAMLFDICLGLFIEWKSSTGKLIILDEAHKYLTNSDANRFTRSICSIIRQQRHLAARVIISTQEPTVVPASVLDLLSWIICHRFSSPGWVRHLKHHICAEEDEEGRKDGNAEWGKRVMTLRTGEGILYSPESLFTKDIRSIAMLATGYAIIKTRPRLTIDGGASLLATEARPQSTTTERTGLPTPPPVEDTSSPALPYSPRFLPSMIPPNTPIPRIIDLVAAASSNPFIRASATPRAMHRILESPPSSTFAPTTPLSPTLAPKAINRPTATPVSAAPKLPNTPSPIPMLPTATPNITPKPPVTPSTVPAKPPGVPVGAPAISSAVPSASVGVRTTYADLIKVLIHFHNLGVQPTISDIGAQLTKFKHTVYTGKLKKYIEKAVDAGVLTLVGKGTKIKAKLSAAFLLSSPSSASKPQAGVASPGSSSRTPATPIDPIKLRVSYNALIREMSRLRHAGNASPAIGSINSGGVISYTGEFRKYLEKAQKDGVIVLSGTGANTAAKLLPAYLQPISSIHIPPIIVALLAVVRQVTGQAKGSISQSDIGTHLKKHKDGDYVKAGFAGLGSVVDSAVKRGLVVVTRSGSERIIRVL